MGREGMGTDPIIVVLDQKRLDGPWSVVVIAANSHGNPAFGAGPWALCLAVLHHTRARRGGSLSRNADGRAKLPSTFLRDAIKSTAHPRLG